MEFIKGRKYKCILVDSDWEDFTTVGFKYGIDRLYFVDDEGNADGYINTTSEHFKLVSEINILTII